MKTYKIAYKALWILAFGFISIVASAQVPNTEYFMKSSHQKTSFNPALRARQGAFGFPALGNTSASVQTNTLNLDHLTFKQNGDILLFTHPDVSAESFLSNLSDNNAINMNLNESILSFASYSGKNGYLFFDASLRVDASANIPYSFFEFAKKGIGMNEASYYNLKDVRVNANAFVDLGVGYSLSLLDKSLVVGAKGKVLLGLGHANLQINDMAIDAGLDIWKVNSDVSLAISAPVDMEVLYDRDGKFDEIDFGDKFGIAGFGLGLDLGATVNLGGITSIIMDNPVSDILDCFTFSAAVTDMGFISWNKNSSVYLASSLDNTVITGNYLIDLNNSNSLDDQLDELKDRLEEIVDLQEDETKRGERTSLSTKFNVGLEYEVTNKITVGAVSTTNFNPVRTFTEFTLGSSFRPVSWIEAGLSYSFVHNAFDTFGFALHIAPKAGMNLFLASDYLIPKVSGDYFLPVNTKGVNVLVGISFPMGARR